MGVVSFLLILSYSQFTHPLFRYSCIYEKMLQKIFAVKKVGVVCVCGMGWGVGELFPELFSKQRDWGKPWDRGWQHPPPPPP